jgi:hypothetical protein
MNTKYQMKMNRMKCLGALMFAGLGVASVIDSTVHQGQSYLPGVLMVLGGLGILLVPMRTLTPERIKQIESDPISAAADRHPVMFFLCYFACAVTSLVIFSDLLQLPVDSSFPGSLFKYIVPISAALGVTIGQRQLSKAIKETISQQSPPPYSSPGAGSESGEA